MNANSLSGTRPNISDVHFNERVLSNVNVTYS